MIDMDKVISHLQIIRTWAAVNTLYGMGFSSDDCENMVEWLDDAIVLLKMQEQKTTENKLNKLVKKAVKCCKINKCSDCPFKSVPSKCMSVLIYKEKAKQGGEVK